MKRLLAILGCAGLLTAVLAGALGSSAGAGNDYRVDVVLDDAHGLIVGQLAEVAGAKVGEIKAVKLTPDFKARVQMTIDGRFAPFHQDAHCTIRPQGLIAENYVNCDPGSPDSPPLRGIGGQAPTVPVSHTTAPVAVTDLFDVWSAPVRDRVTLLFSELGLGTAARGDDFNSILRRTNPSLALARNVISVLRRQRDQLTTVLDSADKVVHRVAQHSSSVSDFIHQAAVTTSQTGRENQNLALAVKRLPALLSAADPALRDLDATVKTGTPLARQLRVAAPDLNRLSADIGPFARVAKPTLAKLAPVLAQGTRTLKTAAPLARLMRGYAHNSLPAAKIAGPLFTNLREHGFVESLMSFIYGAAAATARFDGISHFLPAFITLSACAAPATTPVAGCSAGQGAPVAAPKSKSRKQPAAATAPAAAQNAAPSTTKPGAGGVGSIIDKLIHPKPSTDPDPGVANGVKGILGYLLG